MTLVTFHFGVIDLPYSHTENVGKVKKKGKTQGKRYAATTGDVAEKLEDKYGIFQQFWNLHQNDVVEAASEAIAGAFEDILVGAPRGGDVFAAAASKVEGLFQTFLDQGEMEQLGIPGVPTKAALAGVSHRFGSKTSGGRRPSFIDTGLYQSSAKFWAE
jgi:hypothetical protein